MMDELIHGPAATRPPREARDFHLMRGLAYVLHHQPPPAPGFTEWFFDTPPLREWLQVRQSGPEVRP